MTEYIAWLSCSLSILGYYLAIAQSHVVLGVSLKILACFLDFYYFAKTRSPSRFIVTFFYLSVNLIILIKQ
jgi:hypothetical protein